MTGTGNDPWPALVQVPRLNNGEVHVWQASLLCPEHRQVELERLLAEPERRRAERFVRSRDRRRYAVARGCLRRLLGKYLERSPDKISLEVTDFGKPYVADPECDIRFNVAHSEEVALFAFARGREVGIDLEHVRPDVDWRELSDRYFAPEEVRAIAAEPDASHGKAAFFRCWARKEAYVKAVGLGLQVPLEMFAVTVDSEFAQILHTAHDPEQFRRWELRDLPVIAGFAATVVAEGRDWPLRCFRHAGFP